MTDPHDTHTLDIDHLDPASDCGGAEPRWLALLKKAVREDPRGCTGVAARLNKPKASPSTVGATYHRSYVSQVVNGLLKKPAGVIFQGAVLEAFGAGRVDCPHLHTDIARGTCHANAATTWGQVVGTGYARLDQWRACQDCPNNPSHQAASLLTPEPHPGANSAPTAS
jgi:hypothetical protein